MSTYTIDNNILTGFDNISNNVFWFKFICFIENNISLNTPPK